MRCFPWLYPPYLLFCLRNNAIIVGTLNPCSLCLPSLSDTSAVLVTYMHYNSGAGWWFLNRKWCMTTIWYVTWTLVRRWEMRRQSARTRRGHWQQTAWPSLSRTLVVSILSIVTVAAYTNSTVLILMSLVLPCKSVHEFHFVKLSVETKSYVGCKLAY